MRTLRSHFKFPSPKKPLKTADFNVLWKIELQSDPVTVCQLSPCGHPAMTDTPIKRTAANSPAKTNYRRLAEINSRYYGLSLMRTPTQGPYSVRNKGSWLLYLAFWPLSSLYSKYIFLFNHVGKRQMVIRENTLILCTKLFTNRINMRTDMSSTVSSLLREHFL